MSSKSQLYLYDVTLSCQHNTFETVKKVLKEWAKQWVFQKEKGDETGYEHWQCRLSLIKARRLQEIIPKLRIAGLKFAEAAISIMSTNGVKLAAFDYAMKADTRIEGPWSDRDVEKVYTKGVKHLEASGLDPWMEEIVEMTKEYDHRHINVLVDTKGNIGKTVFEDWLEYHEKCFAVWFNADIQRMMEEAYANAGRPFYTINLPRSLDKRDMKKFWAFVENLKDGRVSDGRYKAKRIRMERPHVWIFTNSMPDLHGQSLDRWRFWQVEDRELVTYDYDVEA